MTAGNQPLVNPLIVLREEFDDWAILFDPDTGHAFGLNPVSVFVWRRLDGRHSARDILQDLKASCPDVPPEAEAHIQEFIDDLSCHGLTGYECQP